MARGALLVAVAFCGELEFFVWLLILGHIGLSRPVPNTILVRRDVIPFVPNAKIAWHVWRTPEVQQMCAAASPDNTAHMADRLHSLRTGLNSGCGATLGDWTGPLSPRGTGSS